MNPCETARIPEKNKLPGVCYAVACDGLELPVIDITHTAFACDVSPQELSAIIEDSVRAWEAVQKTPPEVLPKKANRVRFLARLLAKPLK